MATTLKPQITNISEVTEMGPNRVLQQILIVEFFVDKFGPYTVRLEPSQASKEHIVKAVQDRFELIKDIIALTE